MTMVLTEKTSCTQLRMSINFKSMQQRKQNYQKPNVNPVRCQTDENAIKSRQLKHMRDIQLILPLTILLY